MSDVNFNVTTSKASTDGGGPSISQEWTSYTPTGSWNTNVSYTGQYKLVGDTLFLKAAVTCSGAPNAAALTINLPAGFTIDTSKLALGATEDNTLGSCYTLNQFTAAVGGFVRYSSTTAVSPMYLVPAGGQTNLALVSNSAPFSFNTGDSVNIDIIIPVIEASVGLETWQTFTPTGSWTTNTTYTGLYRKIGDTIEVQVLVDLSGAPASGNLTIDLPAGFTADTSKLINGATVHQTVGDGYLLDNATSENPLFVRFNSTTNVEVLSFVTGTPITFGLITPTTPFTFASGDQIQVKFSIPVL